MHDIYINRPESILIHYKTFSIRQPRKVVLILDTIFKCVSNQNRLWTMLAVEKR